MANTQAGTPTDLIAALEAARAALRDDLLAGRHTGERRAAFAELETALHRQHRQQEDAAAQAEAAQIADLQTKAAQIAALAQQRITAQMAGLTLPPLPAKAA